MKYSIVVSRIVESALTFLLAEMKMKGTDSVRFPGQLSPILCTSLVHFLHDGCCKRDQERVK